MSNAIKAFGTLLKIGDGANPENFTTIAEVKDITGLSLKLDTTEVTNHSTVGGWKEFVPTLLEAGEVSFDINFIPTESTHSYSSGLIRDMVNRTKRNFKLVFPDGANTTWLFAAYVTEFEVKEPVDEVLNASVTLKITGSPTLA